MVAVKLAKHYPDSRVVVMGREENSDAMIRWLEAVGLRGDRLQFEAQSRSTFENVLLGQKLIQPEPKETWLLVTSAQHMPRSVGVFRKAGWPVIPYPVDYQTTGSEKFEINLDVAGNLCKISGAMKEWIGLFTYYTLDRTSEFFPSPRT